MDEPSVMVLVKLKSDPIEIKFLFLFDFNSLKVEVLVGDTNDRLFYLLLRSWSLVVVSGDKD